METALGISSFLRQGSAHALLLHRFFLFALFPSGRCFVNRVFYLVQFFESNGYLGSSNA